MTDADLYVRAPIRFHGTIPVFSAVSDYTENYEQIAADHLDSLAKHGTNPFIPEDFWLQTEQSTIDLIKKYARPGDRILDAGVGLGRLLSHFPDLQRYGMDISLGYLEVAQSKGINVCYALIEDMPYPPGHFDLVVTTDVLEHVIDLHTCCLRLLSVLRTGGYLIIRVPYRENLQNYLSPDIPYTYVHLRNFDDYSLRLLFERLYKQWFVEQKLAGYLHYRIYFRYTLPFPYAAGIASRTFKVLKRIFPALYHRLISRFFFPVEMNLVIQKTNWEFLV